MLKSSYSRRNGRVSTQSLRGSSYLDLPLRTREQAKRDVEIARKELRQSALELSKRGSVINDNRAKLLTKLGIRWRV